MKIMWPFKQDQRNKMDSVELAQTLVNELVRQVSVDTIRAAKDFLIDTTHATGYEDKMRLYQLAVLIKAIMLEEQSAPKYLTVRTAIEKSFFVPSSDPQGHLLGQVQFAMSDLGELFTQKKEMSWAICWLAEIGIHESNPVKLTLFASHWMGFYEATVKSLRQIEPT